MKSSFSLFFTILITSFSHAQTERARSLLKNVVRITAFTNDTEQFYGFGFITGEKNDKFFICTAAHVVEEANERVEVRFHDDHLDYTGKVIRLFINDDIALVEVDKPVSFKWSPNCLGSASVDDYVAFIGRDRDWYVPTQPALGVISRHNNNLIEFDIKSVRVGTSGAPLIHQTGIIGMIIEDDPSQAIAVDLDRLRAKLSEYSYFFKLKKDNANELPSGNGNNYREMISNLGLNYNSTDFLQAVKENDFKAVDLFLKAGMRPSTRSRDNDQGALEIAAENGHVQIVERLLQAGANIHRQNNPSQQYTPIMYAATSGSVSCLQVMYEFDPTILDNGKGNDAVTWAAYRNMTNSIQYLIKLGVDVSGNRSAAALHGAATYGHTSPIEILDQNDADLNAPHLKGVTALMKAADRGHLEVVQLLLQLGADKSLLSEDGFTALSLAKNRNYPAIAQLLKE